MKGSGPPEGLGKPIAAQVYAIDPGQPVMEIQTLEAALRDYVYARPRFNLLLLTVFAVLGLVLALFGVYGVIATSVAQRTREIGIRLALGASFRQVIGNGTELRGETGRRGGLARPGGKPGVDASAFRVGSEHIRLRPIFFRRGNGVAFYRPDCLPASGPREGPHG